MHSPLPTASLCIYGANLDPAIVSDLLGVAPTSSHRRGDERSSPSGKIVRRKTGAWILFTEIDNPHELVDSVTKLLDGIKFEGSIPHIPNVTHASVVLVVGLAEQPAVGVLPAGLVKKIADLGLDIAIEAYPSGPQS